MGRPQWPNQIKFLQFEMFDHGDEETWPEQQKYNYKDKYKSNDISDSQRPEFLVVIKKTTSRIGIEVWSLGPEEW